MQYTAINFTCPSCGGSQIFSPTTGSLKCEFCESEHSIEHENTPIIAHDYHQNLASLDPKHTNTIDKEINCKKCGGVFSLKPLIFASHCPYCKIPALTQCIKEIHPESVVPFSITKKDAQVRFKKWAGSRWFAPTAFTKYFRNDNQLKGYYLPHWSYDTDTISHYDGKRGDAYYVTVSRTVTDDKGNQHQEDVQERRIRWTHVSGVVHIDFDDVTVGASKTLPRSLLDTLEPWDCQKLEGFKREYLAGFEAQEYEIGLKSGFDFAKTKMSYTIKSDIRQDIGGDEQQIHHVNTTYNDLKYKNILFPLWISSFKWKEKIYDYAINAQTGKVVGERPYSIVKIAFAVITVLAIVAGFVYFQDMQQG